MVMECIGAGGGRGTWGVEKRRLKKGARGEPGYIEFQGDEVKQDVMSRRMWRQGVREPRFVRCCGGMWCLLVILVPLSCLSQPSSL